MSFEWWWNNEISEVQKAQVDLTEVSTSGIEKLIDEIKQVRELELEDRENDLSELDLLEQQLENWADKEKQIKELQLSLYEKLWIDIETGNNSDVTKFVKWVVDWLVVNNLEEIQALIESSINELIDMFKSLFDVEILTELIKQTVSELWDIWNIMENPYNWGLALGTLWLWGLGKLLKWLKLSKWLENKEALDKDKTDLLEMKWTYKLDEIKNLNPKEASKKIEEFSDSIDIKYLLDNPSRVYDMLDIIEWICNFTDKNLNNILKLWQNDLTEYKNSFIFLRKKIKWLSSNNELKWPLKNEVNEILNNNIRKTYWLIFDK